VIGKVVKRQSMLSMRIRTGNGEKITDSRGKIPDRDAKEILGPFDTLGINSAEESHSPSRPFAKLRVTGSPGFPIPG
jgi:hypothetical protein